MYCVVKSSPDISKPPPHKKKIYKYYIALYRALKSNLQARAISQLHKQVIWFKLGDYQKIYEPLKRQNKVESIKDKQ